jgi:RNA polymerase sigma factor (sigma-70 family)
MHELFEECWELYHKALYKHCFYRLYDSERAADAVQEVYLRFWNFLESGKTVDNPRAFLYKITNNLIIDLTRKKMPESLEARMESHTLIEPSAVDKYDGAPFTEYTSAEITSAIGRLPISYQIVLYMRYFHDLSPEEIADFLQTNYNTVSVKINRAMKVLRKHLEH